MNKRYARTRATGLALYGKLSCFFISQSNRLERAQVNIYAAKHQISKLKTQSLAALLPGNG
jgi:hypothetical protein